MSDQTRSQIDPPAGPPGWEGAAERLYTIRSADGSAIAWVCPEIGGNAVGYCVRVGERWVQVFDVGTPDELRDTPSRYGLPVLFPFPGNMRNGRYQWAGREHLVPPTYPSGSDPDGSTVIHGFAHIRPWRFVEQDDDRMVLAFRTPDALDAARADSYPFTVRLTHEIRLGPDGLTSVLVAENQGATTERGLTGCTLTPKSLLSWGHCNHAYHGPLRGANFGYVDVPASPWPRSGAATGNATTSAQVEHQAGDREVEEQAGSVHQRADERRRDDRRVDPQAVEHQREHRADHRGPDHDE
jgi:Aldose 1-epimerase